MEIGCLPFKDTGFFSKLMEDYTSETPALAPFYGESPDINGLNKQRQLKQASFSLAQREILQKVLREQYKGITNTKEVEEQIKSLGLCSTTTVVTGHQLNLFSGPLYFLYKIIAVVNLASTLSKEKDLGKVVPIYWMATEDHDFEEINYFNFKGVKLNWTPPFKTQGAVGRYPTTGLETLYSHLETLLGSGKNAKFLLDLFKESYLAQPNLAQATRYFAHTLFGAMGLLILDADHPELKKQLIPHIKKDIFEQTAFKKISNTNSKLLATHPTYHIQVNPREINYFYLDKDLRERIVATKTGYAVNNTNISFTKESLEAFIESNAAAFSPNVIARPLYQEVILPNIAYIGGGGELAYWLELKEYFENHAVLFPVLMLRNSALLLSKKQFKKWTKMELSVADLFLKRNPLINKKIRTISNIDLDLSPLRLSLHEQFLKLYELAQETDASFLGAVQAQEVKQLKGVDVLEKKLLLAQKRKLQDQVIRLSELHEQLFPNQNLQERNKNFSEFYLEYGQELITSLEKNLDPLKNGFSVLSL